MDLKALIAKMDQIESKKFLVESKDKGDGNLANNAKPYDKVTRGDVIAGRLGKDEKGGKKDKAVKESGFNFKGSIANALLNEFGITEKTTVTTPVGAPDWAKDVTIDGQKGTPAPKNPWENDPSKASAWAALSPEDQKFLGGADPTDPAILNRAPNKGKIANQPNQSGPETARLNRSMAPGATKPAAATPAAATPAAATPAAVPAGINPETGQSYDAGTSSPLQLPPGAAPEPGIAVAGGAAKSTAKPGGDPNVMALQDKLIAAGAKIAADGRMGPATQAAMKQFPDVAKQFPGIKAPVGAAAAAPSNPKVAVVTKQLDQIDSILKKATAPTPAAATPGAAPAAPAAAKPAAPAAPAAAKPAAPAASLPGAGQKGPTRAAAAGQDQSNPLNQRTFESSNKKKTTQPVLTESFRDLINKVESFETPVQEEEQVNELVPAVLGIAGILAGIKGGSDYLDKVAASKQAAGTLKPEEVAQLADLINQLEKSMEDPELAKAIEADKTVSARLKAVSDNAKKLQDQAAMAKQTTAQTIGGTVGAAVKEPFRQASRAISGAAGAVGDFFKGAVNA